MRLASFIHRGIPTYGLVTDAGLIDLGARLGGRFPTLRALLAGKGQAEAAALASQAPDCPADAVQWLPVIPDAPKIFCVGLNYEEHRLETRREKTEHPTIFLRLAASQIGHGAPLLLPPESSQLDYEGEIAVIIGKPGRRIGEADAWDYIAGYAPYNDATLRDWQRHTTQWAPGKNFVGTGAFGPWMVTADEIAPGERLELTTRLNGQVMQHADTDMLINSIPRILSYLSHWTILEPGDVVVTGTPGGVGARREPPVWMKAGDVVEIEVSRLGVLRNTVVAEG